MKKQLYYSITLCILLISFTSQSTAQTKNISNELEITIMKDIQGHKIKDQTNLSWKYNKMSIEGMDTFFNVHLWYKDKMVGSLIYDCTMQSTNFRIYAINKIINLSNRSINSLNKEFCKK